MGAAKNRGWTSFPNVRELKLRFEHWGAPDDLLPELKDDEADTVNYWNVTKDYMHYELKESTDVGMKFRKKKFSTSNSDGSYDYWWDRGHPPTHSEENFGDGGAFDSAWGSPADLLHLSDVYEMEQMPDLADLMIGFYGSETFNEVF